MTDERIQRLTELARRVWPGSVGTLKIWVSPADAIVSELAGEGSGTIFSATHPRALDMLEAALLVGAGELTCVVEAGHLKGLEERAEAAEARVAELEDEVCSLERRLAGESPMGDAMLRAEARVKELDAKLDEIMWRVGERVATKANREVYEIICDVIERAPDRPTK